MTTLLVAAATATAAGPPSVTISLSRPTVVYGERATLSGKVADNKVGQSVQVTAEPYAATSFSPFGSRSRRSDRQGQTRACGPQDRGPVSPNSGTVIQNMKAFFRRLKRLLRGKK